MTRSKVKVKFTEVWKLRKWLISKSLSPLPVCMLKRVHSELQYDTARQNLNFNETDFWYLSSFGVIWPSNLGCPTFGKFILPLRGVERQSLIGLIFCVMEWVLVSQAKDAYQPGGEDAAPRLFSFVQITLRLKTNNDWCHNCEPSSIENNQITVSLLP